MNRIKIVLSVIIIIIAATFTEAQTPDKKGGQESHGNMHKPPQFDKGMKGGFEGHFKMIREKLHLTDQQVSKIEALRTDHMKKMVDLKADLKKDMIDLKSIREKDNFTRADIIGGVEKANKSRNDIALAKANHLMDLWELLTPEQQKLVKDNPQWLMEGRHRMMHRRMDGKKPPMMHKKGNDQ
ncbi:MAG: Spy/CpxP family protein refolding chaperone [Ignavibacteriaceae bacterium]|nr:Spy/CpxP family protein refolding chaperone [Ignavibacteriaceae bacterium]